MAAIGLKVRRAEAGYDLGKSKFFGAPTMPGEWADDFSDDVIFLCQLRLEELAALDTEHKLPHTGYLYFFLDVEMGYPTGAFVRYYDGEPDTVIDDFNESDPQFASLCDAWEIEFAVTDDDADGIKLLGIPADWGYEEPAPELLLQFDPLAEKMGFLEEVDGFMYLFYGEDRADWDAVSVHLERS